MSFESKIEFMNVSDVQALSVMELASEYPMIEGDELDDLITSVETNGVREALVLFDNSLLDGRNRLKVAIKCDLETVPVRHFVGTIEEAEDLIVDLNERRRHMEAVQRAYVADRHRGIIERRAKERQKATQAKPGEQVGQVVQQSAPPNEETGKTREILADKHNVNHRYIDNVKKIRQVSEETISDPYTSDPEAVVQTPRAMKAATVLTKLQKGKISMNDAMEQVFGPVKSPTPDDPVSKANTTLNKLVNDLIKNFEDNADIMVTQGSPVECEGVRLKLVRLTNFVSSMNIKYEDLDCGDLLDSEENQDYWNLIEEEAAEFGERHDNSPTIKVAMKKACGCDFSGTEFCDLCRK